MPEKFATKTVNAPPSSRSERTALEQVTNELWQRPGFLLRRCLQYTSGVFEQSCAEVGMTTRQYDYLFVLEKLDELGQGELGSVLGLDRATNALVLKNLEKKKWVRRAVPSTDTRKRVVQITAEGRKVLLRAMQAAEISIESVSNALTPSEYQQLLKLMRKVAQSYAEGSERVPES